MKTFINMDFNGSQWWVEYNEDGSDIKEYFDTEEDATSFYYLIIVKKYNAK